MEKDSSTILEEFTVCEVPGKDVEWRLTINSFRDVEYLHLRKYYLSFDGEFLPSNEGACFPATLDNISKLFASLLSCISTAEALTAVVEAIENLDLEVLDRLSSLKEKLSDTDNLPE